LSGYEVAGIIQNQPALAVALIDPNSVGFDSRMKTEDIELSML